MLKEAIQKSLTTGRFGRVLEVHTSIDSTNTRAAQWARQGCPEGATVLADTQSRGRGRLGRSWVSPPGCNLYCSLVARPQLRAAEVPGLTLTAGLATAETVARWVPDGVAIKWPNDVLIRGRKAAGILTEMEAEGERTRFVVIGIGVNLNLAREALPPGLQATATSIAAETGHEVDREAFCASLLAALETRYEMFVRGGFAAIHADWNRWNGLAGRRVRIAAGDRILEGKARELRGDGRLEVETVAGVECIVAGDVSVVDWDGLA